jgi:hypothetical protein
MLKNAKRKECTTNGRGMSRRNAVSSPGNAKGSRRDGKGGEITKVRHVCFFSPILPFPLSP